MVTDNALEKQSSYVRTKLIKTRFPTALSDPFFRTLDNAIDESTFIISNEAKMTHEFTCFFRLPSIYNDFPQGFFPIQSKYWNEKKN